MLYLSHIESGHINVHISLFFIVLLLIKGKAGQKNEGIAAAEQIHLQVVKSIGSHASDK